jgi:hypothetical protein
MIPRERGEKADTFSLRSKAVETVDVIVDFEAITNDKIIIL